MEKQKLEEENKEIRKAKAAYSGADDAVAQVSRIGCVHCEEQGPSGYAAWQLSSASLAL